MAQSVNGLYSLLSIPGIYSLAMRIVGGASSYRRFLDEYVKLPPKARVLDIGCGPADILAHMPDDVHYVGIDLSERYIQRARERYGNRGEFICCSVNDFTPPEGAEFDVVLAIGVLHHLDDGEAIRLFQSAHRVLTPQGFLVTLDGTFVEGQNLIARTLIKLDRGKSVRTQKGYSDLAYSTFDAVEVCLISDLSRVSYTHCRMSCVKQSTTILK